MADLRLHQHIFFQVPAPVLRSTSGHHRVLVCHNDSWSFNQPVNIYAMDVAIPHMVETLDMASP
eukprot:496078-Amphidinium_carterae.1